MPPSTETSAILRPAKTSDLDAIARIMNYPPDPPFQRILGASTASQIGVLFVLAGITIRLSHTTVACTDGDVVGVMECGRQDPMKLGLSHWSVLMRAVRIIGLPRLPRAIRGFYLRRRVSFDDLPGAFAISELYVDEQRRNQGIGGRLLREAEEMAATQGVTEICLETGIDNPARRLYERNGFVVTATKSNRAYERISGSPGRILMVKERRHAPIAKGGEVVG
jgi:ribosomal protein S18 acetylase RimI-like enzyme